VPHVHVHYCIADCHCCYCFKLQGRAETVFKEKHGVWYPMPEMTHLMSTPEPTPTHGPWATLCQSRPQPYARVDFIPQSGTKNLVSGVLYLVVREHGEHCTVRMVSEIGPKITENIFRGFLTRNNNGLRKVLGPPEMFVDPPFLLTGCIFDLKKIMQLFLRFHLAEKITGK
jgi:hypothetical protein